MTDNDDRAMPESPVVLICMPWDMLKYPSIQLGVLKPTLERGGIATTVRQYNLAFMEHLATTAPADRPFRLQHFIPFTRDFYSVGLGDWIFCVPPFREPSSPRDEEYLAYLRSEDVSEAQIERAKLVREQVPAFLDWCVEDVMRSKPRVVGFTTAFNQNISSLVLARRLKEHDASLKIVLGGGNCEGPMGAALHRAFPWVDVVVRGEAEGLIVDLVEDLLADRPVRPRPGVCVREHGEIVDSPEQPARRSVAMDDLCAPSYDDYFDRLERSSFRDELLPEVRLLYEGSRGCWWGQKSHCTFCGIRDLKFFSKSGDRVFDELVELSGKYGLLNIDCVDNIIDMGYFDELLPRIRDAGFDFRIFFETKSNLKREHVKLLAASGVRSIQPGIESLSSPILKLIRKGVSALQNIRLLKWCAQYKVAVGWNVIYGFPGEPAGEYAAMAEVMKSLTHLHPPALNLLHLDRFSPYHDDPARHGISITGAARHYGLLYDVDEATRNDLAYHFEYRHDDGRDPESYVGAVREVVKTWQARFGREYRGLRLRLGPGFMTIVDHRTFRVRPQFTLDPTETDIYLACDAGATAEAVVETLAKRGAKLEIGRVADFLDRSVESRLVYREGDRYLSLAVAENAEVVERFAGTAARTAERTAAHDALISIRRTAAVAS